MANDWLNHKELKIMRGVFAAPGDANSVEPAIVTCNLMSSGATGIALKPDGWSPNIPNLKNSGVWADSPISDGRTLISGVDSNVTESMQLVITGSSFQEAVFFLSQLRQMTQDARDFWQDNAQINPVYLKWWAVCGAGPQYALIYSMDFKPEYVASPTPTINVTLTIERECYWRSIPPGANPKQWTYEFNGQANQYDYTKAALSYTRTDHLYKEVLQNQSAYNPTGVSLLSKNFLTIPAASIPGDAPALMLLSKFSVGTGHALIIGKKTAKVKIVNSAGSEGAQNCIQNFADGTLVTDATLVADAGAAVRRTTGAATRVEISFATATNQLRWVTDWGRDGNRLIGRYMVFVRCRQQGGTLGDITMYLRYGGLRTATPDTAGVKLNVVNPPVIAGAGASTVWGFAYMGVINAPPTLAKATVNAGITTAPESIGLENFTGSGIDTVGNLFTLFALRSAGVAPLYLSDIILIPIDEGSFSIVGGDSSTTQGGTYDETGYATHGTPDVFSVFNVNPLLGYASKISGPGIQLTPNVENRLHFVLFDDNTQSTLGDTATFVVDIVPRWVGMRGV